VLLLSFVVPRQLHTGQLHGYICIGMDCSIRLGGDICKIYISMNIWVGIFVNGWTAEIVGICATGQGD